MSNIDLARNALVYARDGLSYYKSDNKSYADPTHQAKKQGLNDHIAAEEFRINKTMIFQAYNSTRPSPGAAMDMVVAHGRAALKQRAGNCQEYTGVVCSYLAEQKPRPVFDAVYLEPPGDHTFVVIGESAGANGEFPMQFANWQNDTAICDPWVNIACLANDYPRLWQEKLKAWDNQGKRLPGASKGTSDTGVPIPGGWSTPLELQWLNALVDNKKLSYTYTAQAQNNDASSGCCYISTAVCSSLGLSDDCEELSVLRWFRDEVLLKSPSGRRDVANYYKIAPAIVKQIDHTVNSDEIYRSIYQQWLSPAINAVRKKDFKQAYIIYQEMVRNCIKQRYQHGRLG